MNFNMTNKELSEAIASINGIYMATEPQKLLWIDLNKYLKALIEIQRLRAGMPTVAIKNIPPQAFNLHMNEERAAPLQYVKDNADGGKDVDTVSEVQYGA